MPALLDPDHKLAVSAGYGINNANLYFFGWGALIASICLAGDFAKEANGDQEFPVSLKWFMLGASGLTVMGTSAALYSDFDCKKATDTDLEDFCRRTSFAIYLGLCSAILSLLMVPFKQALMICHAVVALLQFAAWCCGVSFLTF
jgi:hypothetical protein